ncbi:hypothetical protein GCM10007377_16410 [Galliscardovia ingluviei]|uniref:Uncharacterized protein n=1 Tax=Galliscardovia ingluviei TaxID=1769422 RepID=A0A8J3ARG0_9BIFI|nr:hypothetical protein GCM10007377_16410 [Galliscardovia ingluviei]
MLCKSPKVNTNNFPIIKPYMFHSRRENTGNSGIARARMLMHMCSILLDSVCEVQGENFDMTSYPREEPSCSVLT